MASPANIISYSEAGGGAESDYGSDFSTEEVEILSQLVAASEASIRDIEDNPIGADLDYHDSPRLARLPRIFNQETGEFAAETSGVGIAGSYGNQHNFPLLSVDPGYPDLSSALSNLPETGQDNPAFLETDVSKQDEFDERSPLQRFRSKPKKILSVTDLVSPAWCELQYWYSLTKFGRKRRTPAMKQGSAIHKELEQELYQTVTINIESKEDAFGLRIWNVIQGLRTLQETGQTRELEVWGIVDGQIVNGVIDEVSFVCPDEEMEAEIEQKKNPSKEGLGPDQTLLSDYFKTGRRDTTLSNPVETRKVYLCDVKTRSVSGLPKGAAFRPTKFQLMLYHHLLGNLATNGVNFSELASRHDLDPDTPFSDSFIAQMGGLNDEVFYDAVPIPSADDTPMSSQDSMTMLLNHNSLSKLWSLMISYLQQLLPNGKSSISNILKAEYRSREGGEILGCNTFAMDADVLKMYVNHEMLWWKGEREAEGVVMEEAYKCRSCEFAENCEWRLQRVEEATRKARANWKKSG